MVRKNIDNIKIKDLPKIGEIWSFDGGGYIKITMVGTRKYNDPNTEWSVNYNFVDETGKINPRNSVKWMKCSGYMELGRFLHKAKKV